MPTADEIEKIDKKITEGEELTEEELDTLLDFLLPNGDA